MENKVKTLFWFIGLMLSFILMGYIGFIAFDAFAHWSANGETLIKTADLLFITFIALIGIILNDIPEAWSKRPFKKKDTTDEHEESSV